MNHTQIHIVGYGKMGHAVERLAQDYGCSVGSIITDHSTLLRTMQKHDMGVYIDFSSPHGIIDNLEVYASSDASVVCGTTGWHTEADEVSAKFAASNGALLYASNFSIGMHLYRALARRVAAFSQVSTSAQMQITETHHTSKLDAPSGTAITLAHDIIAESDYTDWRLDGVEGSTHLPVRAIREGDAKGLHEITLDLPGEQIRIAHEASSRDVFAIGALRAAKWLQGKSGVYTIDDMMQDLL